MKPYKLQLFRVVYRKLNDGIKTYKIEFSGVEDEADIKHIIIDDGLQHDAWWWFPGHSFRTSTLNDGDVLAYGVGKLITIDDKVMFDPWIGFMNASASEPATINKKWSYMDLDGCAQIKFDADYISILAGDGGVVRIPRGGLDGFINTIYEYPYPCGEMEIKGKSNYTYVITENINQPISGGLEHGVYGTDGDDDIKRWYSRNAISKTNEIQILDIFYHHGIYRNKFMDGEVIGYDSVIIMDPNSHSNIKLKLPTYIDIEGVTYEREGGLEIMVYRQGSDLAYIIPTREGVTSVSRGELIRALTVDLYSPTARVDNIHQLLPYDYFP